VRTELPREGFPSRLMRRFAVLGLGLCWSGVISCNQDESPPADASGGTSAVSGGTSAGGTATGGTSGTTGGTATGGTSSTTGGVVTSGGKSASGGTATGGKATGTGGKATGGRSGTGGSGGSAPLTCSLMLDGATGNEPNGQIPVCCTPDSSEKSSIDEVFSLLNAHRAANGLSALAYDALLEATIQGHCIHMSQHSFFDHTAPESAVNLPWPRATLCGTSANAENIAQGYNSASAVMTGWTNSSGHNANMLTTGSTRVGVGYEATGKYWGQIFGR
jgi:uncharacterized protein YkwD